MDEASSSLPNVMKILSLEESLKALQVDDERLAMEEICLHGKMIGDDGAKKLLDAIGDKSKDLKRIYLSFNAITDEGAILVAEMAEKCEILEILELGANRISDKGLLRIAEMVEKSSSLKKLILYDNPSISDAGAFRLAEMVEKNATLEELNIGENPSISDKGAMRMAAALEKNTTLKELLFHECGITEKSAERFMQALDVNTTLEELYLDGNVEMMEETWLNIQSFSESERTPK
eukprot:TRINITY_DN3158_c0_g1_i3.p1 TRINITY_DN3158_c0_g1~~TRINITY_DN3158_c0_g1_i3.p1  ORF type:complete len:271 (+),score=95.15 TRINITY_DN3158_c0_g1_i3:111-815(+)